MVSFFLERVSNMRPQAEFEDDLDPRIPPMSKWTSLMARQKGAPSEHWFNSTYFIWMKGIIFFVNHYDYKGAYFRHNCLPKHSGVPFV